MTVIVVLFILVGFVLLDVLVRFTARRLNERRVRHEREAALEVSLRLDFAEEAKSLKRADVPDPRATILAVDDEPVVLDSLRRILVLAGYSVDTVENGPEALNLVQRRDYDFVFTDLKMPGMDGVEVVKAVHHLRPDTDIAVITGFATIESAVETMQHGAVAYVEKPFTPEELTEFVNKLRIRREARIEAQNRPTVHVVTPTMAETVASRDFCVPGGAFLADGHTWARLEADGNVRIGLDDFARKSLGTIERVVLPETGAAARRGDRLFAVVRGNREASFMAPVSGRVIEINESLRDRPAVPTESPYDRGWICRIEPSELAGELALLRIGGPVITWYQDEIDRLKQAGGPADGGAPAVDWATFEKEFLRRPAVVA